MVLLTLRPASHSPFLNNLCASGANSAIKPPSVTAAPAASIFVIIKSFIEIVVGFLAGYYLVSD